MHIQSNQNASLASALSPAAAPMPPGEIHF